MRHQGPNHARPRFASSPLSLTPPSPSSNLGISVNVHLDHSVADGLADLLPAGAAASMEDKVDGLVLRQTCLGLDELLGIAQDLSGRWEEGEE